MIFYNDNYDSVVIMTDVSTHQDLSQYIHTYLVFGRDKGAMHWDFKGEHNQIEEILSGYKKGNEYNPDQRIEEVVIEGLKKLDKGESAIWSARMDQRTLRNNHRELMKAVK